MAYKGVSIVILPSIIVLLLNTLVDGASESITPRGRLPFLSVRQNASCKKCLAKCAPTFVSSKWLTECNTLRQNLKNIIKRNRLMNNKRLPSGYRHALIYYCFLEYCRSFKVDEYCGLHPKGKSKRSLTALNSEIALIKKQRPALETRFKKEAVPKFNHANYLSRRAEVQELQKKARANLQKVLNMKAENFRLKKKLRSLAYRKDKFEVGRLLNEIDFYQTYQRYWRQLEENYLKSLRTSAKSVRVIRNQVWKDAEVKFKQVTRVRNFEKAIGNEEKQLSVLHNFEGILTNRLNNVNGLVVRADSDYELFKNIGLKIAGLLDRMTAKIRRGTLDVGCTSEALAIAIAKHTTG